MYKAFFFGQSPRDQSVGVTGLSEPHQLDTQFCCLKMQLFATLLKAQLWFSKNSMRCWPSCLRSLFFSYCKPLTRGDTGPLKPSPQKSLKVHIASPLARSSPVCRPQFRQWKQNLVWEQINYSSETLSSVTCSTDGAYCQVTFYPLQV